MEMLPKIKNLLPSQDYQYLRAEGLKYIESFARELWTDYNVHDPGITIMEALCYAITELGYRTGFDVKDLLAGPDGNIPGNQCFFTARNILTCNPLTINDYRKLLIDIRGVHNAWLYADKKITINKSLTAPVNEVPVYADCAEDKLSYVPTNHPLYLSGLYSVLLDLDNDEVFGDLNSGDVEMFNPVSSGADPKFRAGDISFKMELPYWDESDDELVAAATAESNITASTIEPDKANWLCLIKVQTPSGEKDFEFRVTINQKPKGKKVELADMQDFFSANYVTQVFQRYQLKVDKVKVIILSARKTLHASRNLCEDFLLIKTVREEEVAICCDIDVRPDADMEKVQAEVFYLIETYLNPSVNFYLLKEMLARGIPVEDIFQGPKLAHGFIDTEEMEAVQLRETIYTSDIINLIQDVPGVIAVKNVLLTKYDVNGDAVEGYTSLKWSMDISFRHKPVLSTNKSKIIFFKNNFPFLASYAEIRDTLKLLRAAKERNKLKGSQDDLPVPTGTHYQLDSYYSIQNDLPQTYGVGEAGLPATASALRQAQARQLKAYLLFYDQLLAGFFSQLSNAGKLLSVDDIKQTYFTQYLNGIKDAEAFIYKKSGSDILLEDLLASQDSTASSTAKEWKKLFEDSIVYEDRRNRFLDHLLARFAESFSDYVLMMYSIDFADNTAAAITAETVIANKRGFLQDYPALSYERGKAFNYFPLTEDDAVDVSKLWDTDNVSGLEKRVSKLAGISNYYRRFLSCVKNIEISAVEEKVIEGDIEIAKTYYTFIIQNKHGDRLVPAEKFESEEDLDALVVTLPALLDDKANYLYDAASKKIELISPDNKAVVASEATYENADAAKVVIAQFEKEFLEECADAEGMLLIEHILLRPRTNEYELFQVCLDKSCDFCGEEDPYSFRASVVLPYWPDRFQSTLFRRYFEEMIRAEAPAHTMLKVCWVNNTQMRELEIKYIAWVNALAAYTLEKTEGNGNALLEANNALVLLLPQLRTVYPAATLHDCDESVNTNPVMLGQTKLGTYKNKRNE
ncbi:hypothetical protein [Foetidibacter luteolus]|uniref:hypothetical protein n=1 Tax=Foetidibacter luteolus TaxID=2608880 RepID=UPI00129AA1B9|nr:hypothetical protein [Foetidibacter luteolus]